MAFSATINNTIYSGPGMTTLTGTWSGAAGDAAGTLAVAGTVVQAIFQGFETDQATQIIPRINSSVTSGITTLTINNQDDVATGYFQINKLG